PISIEGSQDSMIVVLLGVVLESLLKVASKFGNETVGSWTGRYKAHMWDKGCRREGQRRKGKEGSFLCISFCIWKLCQFKCTGLSFCSKLLTFKSLVTLLHLHCRTLMRPPLTLEEVGLYLLPMPVGLCFAAQLFSLHALTITNPDGDDDDASTFFSYLAKAKTETGITFQIGSSFVVERRGKISGFTQDWEPISLIRGDLDV
ncbi:hypothetical protein MKX01_029489, partial [Papaver californicum]